MALSARQEDIKAQIIREHGGRTETRERFLELAPGFLTAGFDFAMVPWRKNKLDPNAREILEAIQVACATGTVSATVMPIPADELSKHRKEAPG